MNAPLSPARLLQIGTGFWPAQVLLSAVALDLVPSAQPGDALLVHAGVALGRVTEEKEGEPPCA